jgi:hypothetical protein
MLKLSAALLLAVPIASTMPATLLADFVPPVGRPPGSQYQLIFVTQGTRDATSSNIADYNTFVNAEASLNPLLPQGIGWHVVAFTSAITAQTNAAPATREPSDSAAALQHLIAGVKVQRTTGGGLIIEGPPETASTLAALFAGMAELLQAVAAPGSR